MGLLKADPVSGRYGFVESEARFRAVPVDESADGMIVRSLGTSGGQAVQDRRFRLSEIGELQNGFRIASVFVLGQSSSLHGLEGAGVPEHAGAFIVSELGDRVLRRLFPSGA